MKKMVLILILCISLVMAVDVTQDDTNSNFGVSLETPAPSTNYSIVNTNSSDFWDNLDTPSDISGSEFWYNQSLYDIWVDEAGDTMTGDLDMGSNEITNVKNITTSRVNLVNGNKIYLWNENATIYSSTADGDLIVDAGSYLLTTGDDSFIGGVGWAFDSLGDGVGGVEISSGDASAFKITDDLALHTQLQADALNDQLYWFGQSRFTSNMSVGNGVKVNTPSYDAQLQIAYIGANQNYPSLFSSSGFLYVDTLNSGVTLSDYQGFFASGDAGFSQNDNKYMQFGTPSLSRASLIGGQTSRHIVNATLWTQTGYLGVPNVDWTTTRQHGNMFLMGAAQQYNCNRMILPTRYLYPQSDGNNMTAFLIYGDGCDTEHLIIGYNNTDSYIGTGNGTSTLEGGNIFFGADVHVSKNFTGNQIYGEMSFHNDTGWSLPFAVQDTYYPQNVTNNSRVNGFTFAQDDTSSRLTALVDGVYQVNYHASGRGVTNHVYHSGVAVNNVVQYNTETHFRMGTVNDITTMSGTGFVVLSSGDVVTLVFEDSSGTGTGTVYSVNLNLVRVGNG